MLETSRSYMMKVDRIVVPMAKGDRSRGVLDLSFKISEKFSSEITALTIKNSRNEITWSDKVAIVTRAYRRGKDSGVKVTPKIRSASSVKQGIVEELEAHSYDLLMIATERRSFFSTSILGQIGDYILKKSKIPMAAFSIRDDSSDYREILVPLSEQINTRSAVSFSLILKAATGANLTFLDLRKFDSKEIHGFRLVFEELDRIIENYGANISIVKPVINNSLSQTVLNEIYERKSQLLVMGFHNLDGSRLRLNPSLKSITKLAKCDVALVKK
ncbi:MAG: universal stress protein [Thermoplasmataceae archaeon]